MQVSAQSFLIRILTFSAAFNRIALPLRLFLSTLPIMSSQPMEVVLASRPKNEPDASTFRLQPIANPPTAAAAGGLLLKLVVASVDPYLRKIIRTLPIGTAVHGYHVARVVESNRPDFHAGDAVIDFVPKVKWQTIQQHDGEGLYRIPLDLPVPLSAWVGVLGMTGRAAYFGLMDHEIGRMQPGKVVLVSGAAGAVGSMVGQLARIKGAKKVIGTAGGPEKCARVKEHYRFDECLDYKQYGTVEAMREALRKAAPDGVDIYFENTGGHVTTAAFSVLNEHGRVALAGAISSYNKNPEDDLIPNVLGMEAVFSSLKICAYKQNDFIPQYQQFYDEVPQLVADGSIVYDETVYKGMDKIPEAFAGLFKGHNTGKALVLVE